jgi:LuxR family transcriptional regulator
MAMKTWQEDLLSEAESARCEHSLFEKISRAAVSLNFEHCAYGMRLPLPLSNPRSILLNNYPAAWRARYEQANYLAADPTVVHGRRSQAPLVWTDAVFQSAKRMWAEARSQGLRIGWAQSSRDTNGVAGMLTLSRSAEPLGARELECQEVRMRWLVNVSHQALSRLLAPKLGWGDKPSLTSREVEVLKWTADGKTAGEISDLLAVSEHTVNFHVKNAVFKLKAANKTAAVVRAAMLGLLS